MFCLRFYCSPLSCRAFSSTWLKINIFAFLFRSSATFKHVQLSPSRQLISTWKHEYKNIFSVPLSCPSFLQTVFIRKIIHNEEKVLFRSTRQFENIFLFFVPLKSVNRRVKIYHEPSRRCLIISNLRTRDSLTVEHAGDNNGKINFADSGGSFEGSGNAS